MNYDDRFIDSLARVRDKVYSADSQCKLVGQLHHPGDVDGPSTNNWPGKPDRSALSTDKIAAIVSGFAEEVERHTATFKASVRAEYDGLLASAQEERAKLLREVERQRQDLAAEIEVRVV